MRIRMIAAVGTALSVLVLGFPSEGLPQDPIAAPTIEASVPVPAEIPQALVQGEIVDASVVPGSRTLTIHPRLALAGRLGADCFVKSEDGNLKNLVREITGYQGVDVVLECSGAQAALYTGLSVIRYGGCWTQIGLFGKKVSLNLDGLVRGEIQFATSCGFVRESWGQAISLVSEGRVNLEDMVSHEFPLSEWEKAFAVCSNKDAFKVLLIPD